jgi:hydrogenase/urease accessory protein HupE
MACVKHRRDVPQCRSWLCWACLAAGAGLVTPPTAVAHLVTSGVGPFYDGVVHFFVSPEDLLVVIALALFGGLSGRVAARWLVLALPAAWLVGTGLGLRWPGPTGSGWIPALSMLLAGLLAALNPRVPAWFPAFVALGLGLAHGFLNGRAMASTATALPAAVGIVTALGLVVLLLGALTSALRVPWQKVAARTLGSWMAASGLLALAWSLRPGS